MKKNWLFVILILPGLALYIYSKVERFEIGCPLFRDCYLPGWNQFWLDDVNRRAKLSTNQRPILSTFSLG